MSGLGDSVIKVLAAFRLLQVLKRCYKPFENIFKQAYLFDFRTKIIEKICGILFPGWHFPSAYYLRSRKVTKSAVFSPFFFRKIFTSRRQMSQLIDTCNIHFLYEGKHWFGNLEIGNALSEVEHLTSLVTYLNPIAREDKKISLTN